MNSCLDYRSKEVIELAKQVGVESTPAFADKVGTLMDKLEFSKNIKNEPINVYAGTGENSDLSNFAKRPFEYELMDYETFNTVEGAFHANKMAFTNGYYYGKDGFLTEEGKELWDKLKTASGSEAKKIGRTIKNLDVKKWDNESSKIMEILMRESFRQNPEQLQKLLSTGNAQITHKVNGVEQDKGRFSKLLMKVRDELSNTEPSAEIKPGVEELFESNPELANSIYEALGFDFRHTVEKWKDDPTKENKATYIHLQGTDKNQEFQIKKDIEEGFYSVHFKTELGKLTKDQIQTLVDAVSSQVPIGAKISTWGNVSKGGVSGLNRFLNNGFKKVGEREVKDREGNKLIIPILEKTEPSKLELKAQQLYSQYLDNIFPGSKVKDIVYHGADEKIESFSLDKKKNKKERGLFFFKKRKSAQLWRDASFEEDNTQQGDLVSVLINLKNPDTIDFENKSAWDMDKYSNENIKGDGLIATNVVEMYVGGDTQYAVFEPEQIHILGSKQDIQGFKDFVSSNQEQPLPNIEQLKQYLSENKVSDNIKVEDGKVKVTPQGLDHAQVLLPPWSRKFFEEHFKDDNGEVDFNKINEMLPEVMDMVGYRIPTEDKYSMLPLKVVGFLPVNNGGAIMLPAEITKIAGSDFDVDKLYVMYKNFIARKVKANTGDGAETNTVLEVEKYMDENNSTVEERKRAYTNRLPQANKIRAKYKELIQANKDTTERSMSVHKGQLSKLIEKKELQESEIQELFDSRKELSLRRKALQDEWYDAETEYQISLTPRLSDIKSKKELGIDMLSDEYRDKVEKDYKIITKEIASIDKLSLEIEDKIKSLSSEKIKKDDIQSKSDRKYARLQELLEARKELYNKRDEEILNIISDEDFNKLSIPEQNTKTARDNRIIDINLGVLRSSSTLESLLTPGGYDYLKNEIVPAITSRVSAGTKATDIFNADHVDLMTVQNIAGRDLKGIAASNNKFRALIEHSNLKLVVPARFDGKSMDDLSGKSTNFKSADGRDLVRNIAEQLAASVDNGKDPLLDKINYNEHTAGVISMLLYAGVPPMTVYALMNQRPVREAIRDIRLGKESDLTAALAKRYKEVTGYAFAAKVGESFTQPWDLSQKQLLYQINDNSEKWVKGITQTMLVYLNEANDLSKVMKASKADTAGMGKFIEEGIVAMRNEETALLEVNTIDGVREFLLGNGVNKLTKAFNKYGVENPLNEIFDKVVPYNNDMFKKVKEAINIDLPGSTKLSADESRDVNMHIIQYLLSNSTYYSVDNKTTFIQDMPFTFAYLKKEFSNELAENRLFNAMRPMQLNNEVKFEVLAFDNQMTSSDESREAISETWSAMYNTKVSQTDLDSLYIRTGLKESDFSNIKELFESAKYKALSVDDRNLVYNKLISTFADNLFKYSFLTTGNMFTPKSINTLIPVADYVKLNGGGLQDMLYDILDGRDYRAFTTSSIKGFVDQYFRHYAHSTKVVPRLVKTKEKKDDHIKVTADVVSFNLKYIDPKFYIKIANMVSPVKYLTFKGSKLSLFELFEHGNGNAVYRRIGRLGVKGQLYEFSQIGGRSIIPENNHTTDEKAVEEELKRCNIKY